MDAPVFGALLVCKLRGDLNPFPALGADGSGLLLQSFGDERVEQSCILYIYAAVVVAEQVTLGRASGFFVSLERDEFHALVGGGDIVLGEGSADLRCSLPRGHRGVDALLRFVVVGHGKRHDVLQRELGGAVCLQHFGG